MLKQDKLAGASLLIFINKQDLPGAMKPAEVADVNLITTLETKINC